MKISNVNEMRNLDSLAGVEYNIHPEILMENAGHASYYVILKEIGIKNKNFVIFCGVGNNGGDGLVVARKIHSSGGMVTVFILGDRLKFKGAAKQNLDIIEKIKIKTFDLYDISDAKAYMQNAHAIVDAIFGTGLDRDVNGLYKKVITLINQSQKKIFSIDIPSGVNGDTGQIMGAAIKADYTITFGLPKIGNLLYPGFEQCGKLYVTHISFPPDLQNRDNIKIAINQPKIIPEKTNQSKKGNYSKALFITGSSDYQDESYFAALSFLKAGGGLSFLAAPDDISNLITNKERKIVYLPQKKSKTGNISFENKQQLLEISEKSDMVILGPGLSLNDDTKKLARELCMEIQKPLMISGDSILAVVDNLYCIKNRNNPTILIINQIEMALLTKQKIQAVLKNKINVLQCITSQLNAFIVLKEAHSLIGYPDKKVLVNLSGNSSKENIESADILTGVIGAMIGIGFPIDAAVPMGVFIHGFATNLAAQKKGKVNPTASDIMEFLSHAIKNYHKNFHSITDNFYQKIYII